MQGILNCAGYNGRMTELTPSPTNLPDRPRLNFAVVAFDIVLIALIALGIFYRFNWVNWNQDTDLHPDEYGLTGTLTQLGMPKNLAEYFNTRVSPISPYQKYDENGNPTIGGPDNRMRWGQWPIILIRGTAELFNAIEKMGTPADQAPKWNFTGYGEIRLLGRSLSAFVDTLTLLVIFLIGARLYNRQVGLLAAALSALAVMQIQQSHFMTVDNFAVLFTTITMYACVRIAQTRPVVRAAEQVEGQVNLYQPAWKVIGWYVLFGIGLGMAVSSKINMIMVGGMVLIAVFISIAQTKLKYTSDLKRVFGFGLLFLAVGLLASFITFRLTQPMTFRAKTGDTTFLTLTPNADWVDSMKVSFEESSGNSGGPPAEQWAHRPLVIFALVNMIAWGMGLLLGLMGWTGFFMSLWQMVRYGRNWQAHLLPFIWVLGYFGFMGTRSVMSTRYFLPIYPFLCLFAAWGLLEFWRWAQANQPTILLRRILAGAAIGLTVLGTAAWSTSFMQAVYATPHTRIQAAHWVFQNIAGPFHLTFVNAQGDTVNQPVPANDAFPIVAGAPYQQPFSATVNGKLTQVTLPHVQANGPANLHIVIASDPEGKDILAETSIAIPQTRSEVKGVFKGNTPLTQGNVYYITASTQDAATITVYQNALSNESWDEGLPMRFEGYDPFGGLYRGLSMEVRWYDDINKKQMFLDVISQVDYIIVPSQRAVWAACRIPLTYPMTMDYYRALFNGTLGFDLAAAFSAPMKLGPLEVSDVGGTFAWNKTPSLPLFNHNTLAAEEAFSVYDHPPVWIFKKRADFSIDKVKQILDKADLSTVIVQSPANATGDWCPAQ